MLKFTKGYNFTKSLGRATEFSADCLIMFYICTKFNGSILLGLGFKVIERTLFAKSILKDFRIMAQTQYLYKTLQRSVNS